MHAQVCLNNWQPQQLCTAQAAAALQGARILHMFPNCAKFAHSYRSCWFLAMRGANAISLPGISLMRDHPQCQCMHSPQYFKSYLRTSVPAYIDPSFFQ
jgi:hypothetical protein